jgi:hypothetical protein
MDITQAADTRSELAKVEDELCAALVEKLNEGLLSRIRQLQATNEQMKARLSILQALLDTVKDFE